MPEDSKSTPIPPPPDATRRNWTWWSLQWLLQGLFAVWLRYRSRGSERLPSVGPAVILSNHQSFLDPLLLGLPLHRPISFLARDTLFRIPLLGWLMRHCYVVPLSRDSGAGGGLRETLKRLDQGFLVGVFPEGTRCIDGQLGEIKPGFTTLARRTAAPFYPVGIAGAHKALGRGHWFVRPARVCVVYGEPIPADEIATLSARGRERELLAAVTRRIADCQQEAEHWLRH